MRERKTHDLALATRLDDQAANAVASDRESRAAFVCSATRAFDHSAIWPFIMKVNFVWFFLGGSPLCEAKHRSAGQFLMLYDARHGSVSFGQEQGKTSWQCWPGKSVLVGRFWHRHRSDPMDTMDRLGLSWIGSDRIG